jgi:uncharacterized membrane protein
MAIYVIHPFFLAMVFMGMCVERTIIGVILSIAVCIISGYLLRLIWFVRAFAFGDWVDINRVRFLNRVFVSVGRKFDALG